MKIAIIGSGGAGITSAWLLQADHDVVLFEAAERPGGHAHTVSAEVDGRVVEVEMGTEFFFQEGYTGLLALIERVGLRATYEPMVISLTADNGRTTLLLPPRSLSALAACLVPARMRDLLWVRRLAAAAEQVVASGDWSITVLRLIERAQIPRDIADRLIIPLIASSWGVPRAVAAEMSAYCVMRVMGLRLSQRPHSFRLERGFSQFIDGMLADSPRCELRLSTAVQRIDRDGRGVVIRSARGVEVFDAAILACDWHNSAALCAASEALRGWHRAFSAFEDYPVRVALHRDLTLMPPHRRLWGTGNFWLTSELPPRTTVWSGKRTGTDVFRTWLREGEALPRGTSHVATYRHILVTPGHPARQAALARLQGQGGVYAAGMYTDGIDNHESAIRSGLLAARRICPEGERVKWLASRVSP